MPRVLLIDPIPPPLVERLRPLFPAGADLDVVPTYSEEDLAQHAAEAEILLVLNRKVDAHLLSSVPRVRFVQRVGVGYDNLDLGALQTAGVQCGGGRRAYDSLDAGTAQAVRGRRVGCTPGRLADDGVVPGWTG